MAHTSIPSAAWQYIGIVIVTLSCCSVAAYVAVLVRWLSRADWRTFFDYSSILSFARTMCGRCRAVCCDGRTSDGSLVSAAAYNLFQERKQGMCKRGIYALSPFFATGALLTICRGIGVVEYESNIPIGAGHDIIISMIPVVAALCAWRPQQPAKGILVAMQLIGFTSLMWTACNHRTGLDLLFDRPTIFATRLAFAFMLCDIRLTLALNSAYFAISIYKFVDFAAHDKTIEELGLLWFVYQELGALVLLVAVHVTFSWRMETEARTTIEAKASMNFTSGLSKLLRKSYDVVVELTDELKLSDESTDLSSLLLHGPHRSLQGTVFADLMAFDADKKIFTTHAKQPSSASQSQCSAIPYIFRMRDSDSNLLRLEMWHSKFEDLESRTRHLIGIKERDLDEDVQSPNRRPSRISSLRRPSNLVPQTDVDGGPRANGQSENSDAATEETRPARTSSRRRRRDRDRQLVQDDAQPREGHIERSSEDSENVSDTGLPVGPPPQVIGASSAERRSDGEDSDKASSSSSAASSRSDGTRRQGYRNTTPHAQRTSVLLQLSRWHVRVRAARCCTYHAVVEEARNTVKALAGARCNDFNKDAKQWQCPCCGILAASPQSANYNPFSRTCGLCHSPEASNNNDSSSIAL